MDAIFEGRLSDSPYIHMLWRGRVLHDYSPVCPADGHWNLLFTCYQGQVQARVEGPLTKALLKNQQAGMEFLVIKFAFGAFLPYLKVGEFRDGSAAMLPDASRRSFWLDGASWQLPDFDNAETFVERLGHDAVLIHDPTITTALQDQPQPVSSRTVRRRFLQTTGLTQGAIRQIERAQQAVALLEQGVPILDTVYEAGYADQPHLTRSLKRFYGQTPAQIAAAHVPG